jgi:hypothetical protein
MARRLQNLKALVCDHARYILRPALRAPAWMAGTSPAMTENNVRTLRASVVDDCTISEMIN